MMSLFLLVFFLTIRVVSTRPDVDSAEDPDLATIQMEIKDGSRFMYGTTLAGWLVADYSFSEDSPLWKDVPPEIANQGEYATMQYLGQKEGKNRMKKHRATFYKEQDFADIAAAGLNVVRIPVGYWIAGHDDSASTVRVYYPYAWKDHAPGAMNLLDKVIRIWALKHKLLVIINLHAAKGSQNGYGNSAPLESGNSSWWRYPANVNNSLDVVELLAKRYNSDKAFLGIGLLNEPVYPKKTVNHGLPTRDFLQQYYYDAYGRIRNDVSSGCLLFMSPLLHEQDSHMTDTAEVSEDITKPWDTFMVDSVENIRFEWHLSYLSGYDNYTADELLRKIAVYKNNIQAWEGNPLFIGEWNLASAVNMTRSELKRFSKIQMDSFSIYPVTGWSFNAWKHYGDNEKLDKFAPRAYNLDDKDRRSMKALLRSKILPYL